VVTPDLSKMWILTRQANIPDSIYNEIIESLKKDNFPVEKLERVIQ
jgi:lipocalin